LWQRNAKFECYERREQTKERGWRWVRSLGTCLDGNMRTSRYEIDFLPEYTDEALLDELRRIAALLSPGEPLTKTALKQHSPRVSESTLRRRFGGWKEALVKAGLGHLYHGHPVSQKMKEQPARTLSNENLIAELKRVHASLGKPYLTREDFNRHSITSVEAVRSRFGSFPRGLELAGIPRPPRTHRRLTDAQFFENLANVWTQLGRAPEYREMSAPLSNIHYGRYKARWGTWRRALLAFVDWSKSESESGEAISEAPLPAPQSMPVTEKPRSEADCRDVRPGLRFRVFMRDRFRCVACGRSPATHLNIELHADHRRPVANGGKTTLENLQTLCQDCNLGKGRTLEW